jgi:DNA-binding GntR family transcriptional regulator
VSQQADIIPRTTLVDDVCERLRDAILNGDMQPGERLSMGGLEERFGVSHTPIREALRRLESEGFVIATPQRAAVVAGVDPQDLDGLYDVRRMIEVPTARRAVEHRTPESIAKARQALEVLEKSAPDVRNSAVWRDHRLFHWALLEAGATIWIRRTLDPLWAASERYVRLFASSTISPAMEDHRRFVHLLDIGDVDETEALLLRHLRRTQLTVRRGLPISDGGSPETES